MTICERPIKIAVVAPIMVMYDAISLAAWDTVRAFSDDSRFQVVHFGTACHFPDVMHRCCVNVAALLMDPLYRACDVAIFHFGIFHGLFDALLAGGPPVKIVRFHNVTPAQFVDAASQPKIQRSLRQIMVLNRADEIWADSPTNAAELVDRGFSPEKIRTIPLVVDDPEPERLAAKGRDRIDACFIGRIVPSKGLADLVLGLSLVKARLSNFHLTIAGNTAWSDQIYLDGILGLIEKTKLHDAVTFAGTISDESRAEMFRRSHMLIMPSYHEGFCRPVVEGLRAGCLPVVYDAYNLPHIAGGLGRVVPTGDVAALADAVVSLASALPAALIEPAKQLISIDRGTVSVEQFDRHAATYVAAFRREAVSRTIRRRLLRLLPSQDP